MPKYLMPAEWEPHEATWLAWPHLLEHWPGKFEPIPLVYAEIVRALSGSEKVYIEVNDQESEDRARQILKDAKLTDEQMFNVHFFHIPTNASWARDHGPIFVREKESGKLVITNWIFNGWGNKWPTDLDNLVPTHIGKAFEMEVLSPGIVMEGGSLDVNGKGLLLTTESCLLHKNRNPNLNREAIEGFLKKYLGIKKILWLKDGIVGDDTNGHVDDLSRFVNENTIVTVVEKNPKDANYQILKDNLELLKNMTDAEGNPLNIVELPMPNPVIHTGERLPASYANFYIANTVVIVPTFRCEQDSEAITILQKYFPGRKIIGIDCTDLVWGLGTLHCSTQQQPAK